MTIHIVQSGESIDSIATQYQVAPQAIIFTNQILAPYRLVVGQALLILFPETTHVVQQGESFYSIAQEYGISIKSLLRNNGYFFERGYIAPGDILTITYQEEKWGNVAINGYAYPFIDRALLIETLLYLTSLSIFSYGFTAEGELLPIEDEPLIALALEYDVLPILVLTPFTETGTFNNQIVKIVSEDLEVQARLIENLLEVVREKGYAGVDVDFEFILPEDKDAYAAFVGNLTTALNAEGYQVSVALAPKTSSEQPGLLYEGIDYRALGENANSVLVMTYEWGYTYGPPMAVAPIPQVRQVLNYTITQITPEKVDMGIPNYGYDWPLPYERGVTAATTIGNVQAVGIALENNTFIQFDEVARAPFFEYTKEGIEHVVWFEDVRSIYAKLELIREYNFRGAGYWQLMKPFRANWQLINVLFDIE